MTLDLDSFLERDDKRDFVLTASESALKRTSEHGKRTGQLFLALLREEIEADASSPIDYL